ncbi:MAG: MBOAT family O-acyltransferase, partial [Sphaerochaetaceae bacterium]
MVFISAGFAIFFFVTLAAYYLLPGSTQWVVLLIASMVFYLLAGTPFTIIYLLVSAVSVYYAARYIGQRVDNGNAHLSPCKLVYVLTVCLNVGMLSSLKYMNFLTGNLNNVLELFGCPFFIPPVHWIASLGISYYTLQVVGYLTDVYWGIAPAQRNLCKMALFAGFFPQMVSGPISRYGFLESTLYARHDFDYGKVCMGLQRMLWGVLKKMVIADHLFPFTEMVFNDSGNYSGVFVWIGTLLYVLQIYADFSGCMDIALGASECFGITLPENFREPFASVTIQEFWQRWHITLGLWLRDYIMYPILRSKLWTRLGKRMRVRLGKRLGKQIPTFLAMLVLWILMGVWH